MALSGRLYRCPKCIAPLPRVQGDDGPEFILDPEGNVCPRCGHVFSAAAVIEENYPRPGLGGTRKAAAPKPAEPTAKQEALF